MSENGENLLDDAAEDLFGLVVPVGGATIGRRLMQSLRKEWKRNTSKALMAASTATGLSREALEEFVETNPRGLPLFVQVLWAAGMNGHDETLKAMGAVFGRAASSSSNDDEGLDDAEMALRAMSNLGPRHFRVLRVLDAIPPVESGRADVDRPSATAREVVDATGLHEDGTIQCLVNLSGAGLASTHSGFGALTYRITTLGSAVVEASRLAAGAPAP